MNKEKAWLYCRVAHTDNTALEAQKQSLITYAEQSGYEIIGVSCDTGSGLKAERPGWKEVERAVEEHTVGSVLAVNGGRIARNTAELLNCADWLVRRGVRLVTETDGEIRRLHVAYYMRTAMAEG